MTEQRTPEGELPDRQGSEKQRPQDQRPQDQRPRPRDSRPAPRHRRGRVGTAVTAGVLVLSLAGWGWFASEQARAGWWETGHHLAEQPDEQGWASIDTLRLRLAAVETVREIGGEQPPTGFEFLAVTLEVDPDETGTLSTCVVEARDEQGRLFLAGREVPREDPYVSSLTCGTADPEEDSVPTDQSVLVLVPVDAEVSSVRVTSRDFPPARFLELPLP